MTENERIEQASRELGQTDIRRGTAWMLVGALLVVTILVATIDQVRAYRGDEPSPRAHTLAVSSWSAISSAKELGILAANRSLVRALRDFEDAIETTSILRRALPTAQLVLYRGLGSGNEKVFAGHDGWLYYREEVDHLIGRGFFDAKLLERRAATPEDGARPDPMPAIVDLARQLDARGIALLVVPLPVKAAIYPENLASGTRAPVANPSTAELFARLAVAGVRLFDPTAILVAAKAETREPLYLATDTHWSPDAVELVASAVAQTTRSLAPLPPPEVCERAPRRWRAQGDLAAMLPLPGFAKLRDEDREVRDVTAVGGRSTWPPDRASPVLVLGDSFSNIYSRGRDPNGVRASFADQLGCALGFPVDAITRDGGGASGTRVALQEALRRGDDRLAGKRVVVWQLSMRELSSGDWPLTALDPPRPGHTRRTREAGDLTAIVRSVSPTPRPGSSPYRDCLISLRLSPVDGGSDILVYAWGLRDDRLAEAAGLVPGAEIRLNLTPWSDKERELGSLQRIEPEDDETALLDAYFGANVTTP